MYNRNRSSACWKKFLWQSWLVAYPIYIFPLFFCNIALISLKAAMLPGKDYIIYSLSQSKVCSLDRVLPMRRNQKCWVGLMGRILKGNWFSWEISPCALAFFPVAWNSEGMTTALAITLKSWGDLKDGSQHRNVEQKVEGFWVCDDLKVSYQPWIARHIHFYFV